MELVYNQEYQLQLLERKISRAQGERSNEEKAALAEKIKFLTGDLDGETQKSNLLAAQLKKIEDDVKAVRRNVEGAGKDKEKLEGKIHELALDNDSAARSLRFDHKFIYFILSINFLFRAIIKTKEELLITENFVRLDVKRLRGIQILL